MAISMESNQPGRTSDDEENNARPDSKKLFSYLKKCRHDSQGNAPLSLDGQLYTARDSKL